MAQNLEPDPEVSDQLPSVEDARVDAAADGGITAPSPKRSGRTKQIITIAAILVVLIGIGLAIGIPVSNRNKGQSDVSSSSLGERPSPGPSPSPTSSSPVPPPSPIPTAPKTRLVATVDFLVDAGISDQAALSIEGSPQLLGANFIANDDELQREVPASIDEQGAFLFVQRYVLAVLYYALNGPDWRTSLGFLTPIPECEGWFRENNNGQQSYGAFCDEQERLNAIFIRKQCLLQYMVSTGDSWTHTGV
jgi:hypothetical protein